MDETMTRPPKKSARSARMAALEAKASDVPPVGVPEGGEGGDDVAALLASLGGGAPMGEAPAGGDPAAAITTASSQLTEALAAIPEELKPELQDIVSRLEALGAKLSGGGEGTMGPAGMPGMGAPMGEAPQPV